MHDRSKRPFVSLAQIGRRSFLAGAAALSAGVASGLRPAFADTQVVWVGWQGYDEPLKLGSFLDDAGISLAATYINTNEEIITRLQAGGAGQVDLVTIYFGHIPILIAADLLEPIDESRLAGVNDVFPEFLEVDAIRKDGKLYAVPFTWGTLSMIYDPAAAPRPTSWQDCLKEEFKGKVSLVDDATGLLATWAPIVTGTTTPTRITMDELKKTVDFLIEIKRNHARTLASSYGEATDMFARGEVVTSAIGWDAMVGFAAAKDKVLDYVIPEEGAMVFMDTLAVPKGAPHPDLVYEMLAQYISPEGQQHIADTLTQAIITESAVPLVSEENREIYSYGDLDSLFQKARFYPFWPLEPEGDFVTHDQSQEEYQRFLKA